MASEIQAVSKSSLLGQKLFGFAVKSILGEEVEAIIKKHVDKFVSSGKMDETGLANAKDGTLKELRALCSADMLDGKRQVSIDYRGWSLTVQASSIFAGTPAPMPAVLHCRQHGRGRRCR